MKKDWIGNKKTLGVTLGSSSHTNHERISNDFYATYPNTVKLLLTKLGQDGIFLNENIWENAVGEGHIADVLKSYGYNVKNTDIIDRGYKDTYVLDFILPLYKYYPFEIEDKFDILTNPPFKYATEWVYKSMQHLKDGCKLILLLRIQFLETTNRYKLFKQYPPKYVYVHSSRQSCGRNGQFTESNNAICFCWFIWEKGYKGETTLRWIE